MNRSAAATPSRTSRVGALDVVRNVEGMEARTAAATKKLAASIVTLVAGPTMATSPPAITGPTTSAPDETLDSRPLAAARRCGPTSAGTAPNTAASENTKAVAESR